MGVRAQNIQNIKNMLNKSHPIHRYKANSGNNKKQTIDAFVPNARVFVLSN